MPEEVEATLHRCRTPTDWLCPCGRVARALRTAGVGYHEVRHPPRKRDREEVRDVSGQSVVPVLEWAADGEAICDSVRIVEHLAWRSGRAAEGLDRLEAPAPPLSPEPGLGPTER